MSGSISSATDEQTQNEENLDKENADKENADEKNTDQASITVQNKTCDCHCSSNKGKDVSIRLIPVSHAMFFGPSLDDLIIEIFSLFYTLAEKFGLVRKRENAAVMNKKKKEDQSVGQGGEVSNKKNDKDIVEWLHDEFVSLSEDLKAANEANSQSNACCCGEGNRNELVALQARKNVLNELAEMLDYRDN